MFVCLVSALIIFVAVMTGVYLWDSDPIIQYFEEDVGPPSDDDLLAAPNNPYKPIGSISDNPTINLRVSRDYDDLLQNYRLGLIEYDDLINGVAGILEQSSWLTARRQPSMIWSIPADINSFYQIYVQSSLNNEYTTIFLVANSTPVNKVFIIYDGDYASAVYLDDDTEDLILEVDGFQEVVTWQDIVR